MVAGSADSVADQLKTKVVDAGIDSLIINMPFYTPGVVQAAGDALRPLVGLYRPQTGASMTSITLRPPGAMGGVADYTGISAGFRGAGY